MAVEVHSARNGAHPAHRARHVMADSGAGQQVAKAPLYDHADISEFHHRSRDDSVVVKQASLMTTADHSTETNTTLFECLPEEPPLSHHQRLIKSIAS